MIKKLKLKNFLSYKEATIDFNDFNVILGANASGKTNIVKALITLKNLINGGYQSLEDFDAFMEGIFNKNADEKESLLIEVTLSNKLIIDLNNGQKIKTEAHYYSLELAYGKGVVKESYSIKLQDHKKLFKVLERDEEKAKYTFEYSADFSKSLAIDIDEKVFEIIKYQPLAGKAFSGFLSVLQQAYCNFFLTYALSPQLLILPFFSRNQKILAVNGQNLSGVLQYYKEHNPVVIDSINEIIRRNIPNFDYLETKSFGMSKNFYFTVREKDGKDYMLNELSEGTDLFIGIITALVTTQFMTIPKGLKGVLIIEEPEKNLHPQLMEEIVKVAKTITDKFQVMITTHSSELVTQIEPEDLILLDKKETGSRIKRIQNEKEVANFLEEFSLDQIWLNNDLGGETVNE